MRAVTLETPLTDVDASLRDPQEHIIGYAYGPSGYSKGCRCKRCVEEKRRYGREWVWNKNKYGLRKTIDANEARQAIRYLRKKKLTLPEIARRSGLSECTVQAVATHRKRIKIETHNAILGVEASVEISPLVAVEHALPLLYAMHDDGGMTWQQIANALGYKAPSWLWGVRKYRKYITGKSFRKLFVLYSLLARRGVVPNTPLVKLLEVMRV